MEQVLTLFNTTSKNKFVNDFLQKHYEVETFNQGIEAYTWIHSGHIPDLIVTDDALADMDVRELISRFKNSSYYSEIPVLILQQSNNKTLVDALLNDGADDYVSYPIDPDLLLISVRNLLLKK